MKTLIKNIEYCNNFSTHFVITKDNKEVGCLCGLHEEETLSKINTK
jgi:hypothetical protein